MAEVLWECQIFFLRALLLVARTLSNLGRHQEAITIRFEAIAISLGRHQAPKKGQNMLASRTRDHCHN